ncbi:DNA/RNA helicase [Paenibacillus gansuensis]|uniref:DNA/RNA helicase n=1 Tax=Paenibacillus gansuensis TaxID=306542 RepID=A0ABW5PK14_9BACL
MHNAILFEFADELSAHKAYDTLTELDYSAVLHDDAERPSLHLHLHNDDLPSALQIAQSYGARLIEEPHGLSDAAVHNSAYGMDSLLIPAHVVNEDWVDDEQYARADESEVQQRDKELDPTDDSMNFMSGDVHA